MILGRVFTLIFALLVISGQFSAMAQDDTWFQEVTDKVCLTDARGMYLGAIDLNGDDYPDLVTYNGNLENRNNLTFYLNQQDPGSQDSKDRVFVDFTAESGINANPDPMESGRMSSVVSYADIDNDGDVDIASCLYYHRIENKTDYTEEDRCEVLLNDGTARFTIKEDNG
ncbi:MAG: VCBS repeat-containing protein, partial [Deltaproteobacteria bacterium]|nr:VCBS repeat-containing protein [Deltaproteobacteria bacterium]